MTKVAIYALTRTCREQEKQSAEITEPEKITVEIFDRAEYNITKFIKEKYMSNMRNVQYVCPKCGCNTYISDQFQATGGDFSKLFNVQNKRFCTISCTNCGYTELYKEETNTGMNILDFLMNG